MDIAITGASGLIGTALRASLLADGHRVIPVVRGTSGTSADGTIGWDPAQGTIDSASFEGLDAVVHLAGEGIASGPWTDAQRRRIHDSRSTGTALLASTLADLTRPPAVLASGSAIGWYGDRGDEVLTEASEPGTGFLSDVCTDWEDATAPAEAAGIRTLHLRTGIVMTREGGFLAKQLPIFKAGLGGRAGRGTQWLSWITLADEIAAIRHCLDTESIRGAVNLTAPEPATNGEITKALGAALHRPTFVTVPRAVRHLPFGIGDLLDSLLFTSARVLPNALERSGFTFAHPTLPDALAATL